MISAEFTPSTQMIIIPEHIESLWLTSSVAGTKVKPAVRGVSHGGGMMSGDGIIQARHGDRLPSCPP